MEVPMSRLNTFVTSVVVLYHPLYHDTQEGHHDIETLIGIAQLL